MQLPADVASQERLDQLSAAGCSCHGDFWFSLGKKFHFFKLDHADHASPDLLAAGEESGLARAAELYIGLCGEDPEDKRLWMGLFRVYDRAGSLLGLGSAERRLRLSLVELAPSGSNADPDTVVLPPKLERLLQDIRNRLSGTSVQPTSV